VKLSLLPSTTPVAEKKLAFAGRVTAIVPRLVIANVPAGVPIEALVDKGLVTAKAGVPVLAAERRNEAKRFILLVDTLYDRGLRLFMSAEAPPDALYAGRSGTEAFEWARTASRLIEMQGVEWRNAWQKRFTE
jgi:hypothetical protein